jgi:hypothetical protein
MLPSTTNPKLQELANELQGTLHLIAHAGHASNIPFIKKRQQWLRQKYHPLVSPGIYFHTKDDLTTEGIAYSNFLSILEGDPSTEDIELEAHNILYGDLC